MARIFISFRMADTGAFAGRLTERLQQEFGASAIYDYRWNQRPGRDYHEPLLEALNASQLVLAVVGDDWLGPRADGKRIDDLNDPVRQEIEWAMKRLETASAFHLVPVCVDGAAVPRKSDLPSTIRELSSLTKVDVRQGTADDFEDCIRRLVARIKDLTGPEVHMKLSPLGPELTGFGTYNATPSYFYHLYVENSCPAALTNARVQVLRFQRPNPRGRFEGEYLSRPYELNWAFNGGSRELLPGKRARCNLGILVTDHGWLRFAPDIAHQPWPDGFKAQAVVSAGQQVHMDVQVVADGGVRSDVLTIGINWDGMWDDDPLTMREHLSIVEVARMRPDEACSR
jgi:hypothetical protein